MAALVINTHPDFFRLLLGCPDGKKLEFITSLLDALTTDMVQAINSAAPAAGGRSVIKYKQGQGFTGAFQPNAVKIPEILHHKSCSLQVSSPH